jgi:hypothetical protein
LPAEGWTRIDVRPAVVFPSGEGALSVGMGLVLVVSLGLRDERAADDGK